MNFETQLTQIAEQVQIIDDHNYTVNGDNRQVFNQQTWMEYIGPLNRFGENQILDTKIKQSQLETHLTNTLYAEFYCAMPADKVSNAIPVAHERLQFMQALSQHNHSSSDFDMGWRIYHINSAGQIFAQKNGLLRQAIQNTFQMANPGEQPEVNKTIHFSRTKENTQAQQVFYYVHGDTFMESQVPQVRIYWHIDPQVAAPLISWITQLFNQYKLPFNFKCLNHQALYHRSDSAVLYIEKRYFDFAMRLLKYCPQQLIAQLKPTSPLFTQPLFAGVSYAEDPGNGQSFGMSRCSLIAKGLINAFENKKQTPDEQLAAIKQVLSEKGLAVERLHLNAHSLSSALNSMANPTVAQHTQEGL